MRKTVKMLSAITEEFHVALLILSSPKINADVTPTGF